MFQLNLLLKFTSLLVLLILLVVLNNEKTPNDDIEVPFLSNVESCGDVKILNTYPIHFPDLRYYKHEPYSNQYMEPTNLPHTNQIELNQPYLKAKLQFTALTKTASKDLTCEMFNKNITAYVSTWNSHHHERVFTVVITCDILINIVNATMKVNKDIVRYIYSKEYELEESIPFIDIFRLQQIKVGSCILQIPKISLNIFTFLINQIFPYPVKEHSIKSPFLHKTSLCVSPLRGHIPYLAEWFEYYLLLGIDHFYVYDYMLSDEAKHLLSFYKARGIATVIPWSEMIANTYSVRSGWYYFQAAANNDCVFQFRQTSKYLMFVDTDEFLKIPDTLDALLSDFERNSRFDILVEIEFSNWFYSTQIDSRYEKQSINVIESEVDSYLQEIQGRLSPIEHSDLKSKWHKFESLVTLMSFKNKQAVANRKKFIGKSMKMEETRIHKAFPYHYTFKYELPIDIGYIMHFRDLNGGQFGSRYAEMKDLMKVKIDNGVQTFDLADVKILDTTYLFAKRQAIMSRLKAVQIAYENWTT